MKKNYLWLAAYLLLAITGNAQNVAINSDGAQPDSNAILDLKALNKGLLIPRMGTGIRLLIPNTKGLLVYDTSTSSFWYNTGIDWKNIGDAGTSYWSLKGNYNAPDSSCFIGTRDLLPFVVKVNDTLSGRIDADMRNAFWGYKAGFFSVNSIPPAARDSGLYPYNTAIGYDALYSNTTGHFNVAVGARSLYSAINATGNTATGFNTLRYNMGDFNTASGEHSMYNNTTGYSNAAYGGGSMANNYTGYYNTAVGFNALLNNSGYANTAIGKNAMYNNYAGYCNTFIGADTYVKNGDLFNATAIGYNAQVDASNKVRIGNSAVTVIEGQVPFTTPSDGRFKYAVQEDVKGLDFILKLHPVTYRFDVGRFDAQHGNPQEAKGSTNTNYALQAAYNEASLIRRSGFIAQEVEKAAKASGYDFSGIITPKTEQEHYSLSYESFVVPLVKAIQEQQKTIESQNKTIEAQNKTMEDQNKKLDDMQRQLDEVKQLLQHIK